MFREHIRFKKIKSFEIRKIVIFLALFLVMPSISFAADLVFSPSTASFSVGQTFNVRAEVNPDGESINAVETSIKYDRSKLSVQAISKTGSAFSLWTTEPEFSNTTGTVNFGGGSPTPFSKTSTLVTITFKAIAEGAAEVEYTEGSVLAADGLGTDVLENLRKSVYTINAAAVPPPPPPPPAGDSPNAPVVISDSHGDEDKWYSEDTAEFKWEIPNGVTSVRLLLGSKPDSTPTVPYTPPIDRRIIDGLDEGVSYFHIQFQNESGWGDVTHRKLQIDYSTPSAFEVVVIDGAGSTTPPSLSFEALDKVSDIDRYEITIQGEDPITLTKEQHEELPDKGWEMPRLFDGTYLVTVRAYDLAENMTEKDVTVELSTGNIPESEKVEEEVVVEEKGINWWPLLVIVLVIIILMLVAIIYIQRKRFIEERDYLRRETKEIRDKMEKIFSVLQDELEEQISSLDNKPRLSASEKRVLKSLREALEVSEAFINKEIEDVEKILR
jgi:hypothetical protein